MRLSAQELEAMAIRLVEAREHERRALATALHDTTLQGLIAALWQVDALIERGVGPTALERLRHDLEAVINQTRAVTAGLLPPALEEAGLGGAVGELARCVASESDLAVDVEDRLLGARFTSAAEILVYRTVQEALQKIRQHIRATTVRIVLERDGGVLRATVADDGTGGDEMVSTRDVVRLAGGQFAITSGERGGTVVNVEVPVG